MYSLNLQTTGSVEEITPTINSTSQSPTALYTLWEDGSTSQSSQPNMLPIDKDFVEKQKELLNYYNNRNSVSDEKSPEETLESDWPFEAAFSPFSSLSNFGIFKSIHNFLATKPFQRFCATGASAYIPPKSQRYVASSSDPVTYEMRQISGNL
mmetsp:Transcript_23100/g.32027  ORF Transcript_23100/g.32027 Transcript_23100/m.32027 type:complete len:153 (-) Transcript_23100:394-852(-)|eukprot:CAMPEP_0196579106 /NCGR_PEP_ID=MMETSP1081-20130531/17650_1 /TAXON_ID=36882 /ORGANISM="Pyramimonas amylifera, Strain CCMP720" /LENGTH=152 /DNA_ID=CAMNT_0041898569 /DNA_START=191 /DNA_END=649 /DNA_ORIENTATION=+